MKRVLFILSVFALTVFSASAQLNGNGYYRVKNVGSERYITVKDNRGSINVAATSADLGAVALYKNFDNVASDPGSVLYISEAGDGYKFYAQGTDTYKIIGYNLKLKKLGDGSYLAYQSAKGFSAMYLGDPETVNVVESQLGLNAKGNYIKWNIIPMTSSGDNYFGLTPEVKHGNSHYASFYASFPFTTLSADMKVYYVCLVNGNMAVYKEFNGSSIPASTPLFVKCVGEKPATNKVEVANNNAAAPTDNKLSGVYFCNDVRGTHRNVTEYDAKTMRVLGVTSTGELGYITADYDYLPANRSYLKVPSNAPKELKLMSYEEYIERASHVVTFKIDGEIISQQTILYGEPIVIPTVPEKEGYTFSGWGDVPATMPDNDVTYEGSYIANTYMLTYKIDGEIFVKQSVPYGDSITAPTAPEKEGHTFSGWGNVAATMPAHDVTYEGSYTVNTYILTYEVDGEVYSTQNVDYATVITLLEAPVKEGYTFSGWNCTITTMPAHDVTISGTFTVNTYKVYYYAGTTLVHTEEVAYGDKIPEYIYEPTNGTDTFLGWIGDIYETMPAHDVTYKGSFTAKTYVLTYKIDGEIFIQQSVPYGDSITAPTAPEKEGHTFDGWRDVPSTMPAHDVTCEGSYTVNTYVLTYEVDGEVYSTQNVDYATVITLLEAPVKEGYTFSGWNSTITTMPAHDVTISGTYTVNTYKVYYYAGTTLVHTEEVAYGDKIPDYIYEPTDANETFLGWMGETYETMPAHDVVYTANIANSIDNISDNQKVCIYTLTGVKIMSDVNFEEVKGQLNKGVYIVNKRRIIVK